MPLFICNLRYCISFRIKITDKLFTSIISIQFSLYKYSHTVIILFELAISPSTLAYRFSFINSILLLLLDNLKQQIFQIIDPLVKLLFSIVLWEHLFVLIEKLIVLNLELFHDREFFILSCKKINKVAFYWR